MVTIERRPSDHHCRQYHHALILALDMLSAREMTQHDVQFDQESEQELQTI
jgi:SOS response regulatory protein OraA/RecX